MQKYERYLWIPSFSFYVFYTRQYWRRHSLFGLSSICPFVRQDRLLPRYLVNSLSSLDETSSYW